MKQWEIERSSQEGEAKRLAAEANENALHGVMDEQALLAAEEAEKTRILNKYEMHSYLGMKKYMKKHNVPQTEIDNCLGKFELKKLADQHGVEIPDDPKAMKWAVRN